jgi:hypothetical protein
MNEKFKPKSMEPFPLGIHHGKHFSVVVSRKSGFDGFEAYTPLPCLHLSVSAEDETVTWETWRKNGGTGLVIDAVQMMKPDIIKHFFGDTLPVEEAGTRIELNDENSARRQTVHFHLEIGHRDLFGEDGYVRQCVESLLKPKHLLP